jgi:hypothetical protein
MSFDASILHSAGAHLPAAPKMRQFQFLGDSQARALAVTTLTKAFNVQGASRLQSNIPITAANNLEFTTDQDYHYFNDEAELSKILRIGSLVLCPVLVYPGTKTLDEIVPEINRMEKSLGETYYNNFGNIFFYSPTNYGWWHHAPLNPHAQDIVASMLSEYSMLNSANKVVELGAGDGLHSRISLAFGAKNAFLIDNEQYLLDRASVYLNHDSPKWNGSYNLINADLSDQERMSGITGEYRLNEGVDAVLINIGCYRDLYGDANNLALQWAMGLLPKLIISSGYTDHGSRAGIIYSKETDMTLKMIERNGMYSIDIIRNAYAIVADRTVKPGATITFILRLANTISS